ncbi:peptidase M24, structural domain-containing protein [Aspergillus cavernicola]|uniref:Xaa-Pro aminopeptidase n=1 Tax=Aspergillus cavernicola TaxID=176166 RepID=A0ABR4I8R8_9EURO
MRVSDPSRLVVSPDDTCDIRVVVTDSECDKYPAKQHARRVATKLGARDGLIYLVGKPTLDWGDSDQPRPFRQRRYFYYISGVDEADCYVTYDVRNDLLTLYVPNFDLQHAIWMGPTLTVDEARKRYDIDRVRYYDALQGDLATWVDRYNKDSPIYILHPTQKPRIASEDFRVDFDSLLPAMNAAREVKDEYEIRMIRQANKISDLAHRRILENIHCMSNEAEIEGLFLDTCVSHGAKNQSYEIIAGSGPNAAVLHYVKNDEPIKGRQLVCLDAGAEWNCYASDVTRTIPLGQDWPSAYAKDIYTVVEEMQEECIRRVKQGVRFRYLHELAHVVAIKGLQRLGILKDGSVEEIRRSGASSIFFPHGLGHHVGLEVHDVSALPITASNGHQKREFVPQLSTPLLQEGMVITIEPGLYFNELALKNAQTLWLAKYINFEKAEQYIPIGGVRIEDDLLVTSTGYENLTTAPKGEEMLKILRRETN